MGNVMTETDFGLNGFMRRAIRDEFKRMGVEAIVEHSPRIGREVAVVEIVEPGRRSGTEVIRGPMHLVLAAAVRASDIQNFRRTWNDVEDKPVPVWLKSSKTSGTQTKQYLRALVKSLRAASHNLGKPNISLARCAALACLARDADYQSNGYLVPKSAFRAGLREFNRQIMSLISTSERNFSFYGYQLAGQRILDEEAGRAKLMARFSANLSMLNSDELAVPPRRVRRGITETGFRP